MKILHLIYTSGPFGAEKHLLQLLPELKKHNIDCEAIFICPRKNLSDFKEYCNEMKNLGIKITLLPLTSKISLLSSAFSIHQYLKNNQINHLHSHLFSADFIAVAIKKIFQPHLVLFSTKHGYEENYLLQYGLGSKKIKRNFYYFISKYITRRIDNNVAVSKTLSQLYTYLGLIKNEMKFINHGIKPNQQDSDKIQLVGEPRIMIAGRLSEIKGHTYLLKAMPQLITRFPDIKLYILGIGPLKHDLYLQAKELQILDHIEFVGLANPANYTSQCQAIILPSLFESFGLVFIESFALKIPVIAFDTVNGNQIIKDNLTGYLVQKEDVNALAEKIIYVLNSSENREKIVQNAFEEFLDKYTVEKMAAETAKWYKQNTIQVE